MTRRMAAIVRIPATSLMGRSVARRARPQVFLAWSDMTTPWLSIPNRCLMSVKSSWTLNCSCAHHQLTRY